MSMKSGRSESNEMLMYTLETMQMIGEWAVGLWPKISFILFTVEVILNSFTILIAS